jgi:DNA-binding NarL/FixJ family response regulator
MAHAVQSAASIHPDIAVVDFQLPDGDGAQAALQIRAVSPETRVLMLTGLPDEDLLVAAIEAGCAGFLTKTKAAAELVVAIRVINSGEPYIPPALLAKLLPRFGRESRGVGHDLTKRERQVLQLLATGKNNQLIADELYVSLHTVRNHVQHILEKLGAHSKLEAAAIAAKEGLISPGR